MAFVKGKPYIFDEFAIPARLCSLSPQKARRRGEKDDEAILRACPTGYRPYWHTPPETPGIPIIKKRSKTGRG
jgi:hypothetical protein